MSGRNAPRSQHSDYSGLLLSAQALREPRERCVQHALTCRRLAILYPQVAPYMRRLARAWISAARRREGAG